MVRRIWAVVQKEFVQTLRDRRTLVIQLFIPVLQLFLFGYAISMNVRHIPTLVADQSLDTASRAYVEALEASTFFEVQGYTRGRDAVVRAIDEGEVQVGVVIPPDFKARVERSEGQVLVVIDGADLFTSQSAYNAALAVSQAHASEVLFADLERAGLKDPERSLLPLETRVRILYNPNLDDLWFLIPSMAAMLLQTQTISMTAAAVVREREMGTMEQLLVTPIRSGELLLGKIVPNVVIALLNMLTIVGFGILWFGVPFQGDFLLFCSLSFMYVFSGLGLGLLLSTISQNQKQAQQYAGMMMLLGLVIGGFIFPRETMPPVIQAVGYLFPLTYFIPIARGVISKGIGIEFLWGEVLALLFYTVVIIVAATRVFRQELD
ncbi:MAG: ABC transporter permease [Anaerolineales bacterium]